MADIPYLILLGAVDGLNICSLSLMALFLSTTYSLRVSRLHALLLCAAYIAALFGAYLAVGVGLMAVVGSDIMISHIFARVALGLMLFAGVANIVNSRWPGTVPIPATALGARAASVMKGGSAMAAVAAGALVGLHNLPCACTGGLYPVFIGLVAGTDLRYLYLVLYNLMYIVPLALIAVVGSSKPVAVRIRATFRENAARTKLFLGLFMVGLSMVMLVLILAGVV